MSGSSGRWRGTALLLIQRGGRAGGGGVKEGRCGRGGEAESGGGVGRG